jgi:hypothetical protein
MSEVIKKALTDKSARNADVLLNAADEAMSPWA